MAGINASNYNFFAPSREERVFLLSEGQRALQDYCSYASYQTLVAWAKYGRKNYRTNEIVKLRVCRYPSGLGCTVEEFFRFIEDLN